jgi:hypothetical protein
MVSPCKSENGPSAGTAPGPLRHGLLRPIGRSRNVVRLLAATLVPNIAAAVTAAHFAGGVILSPLLRANAIVGP